MKIKLTEIAEIVKGKIVGNPDLEIENLSNIQDSKQGDLTFLYMSSYLYYLKSTKASAVLIPPDFEKLNNEITYIEVNKPNIAFQQIINRFFKPEFVLKGIDESSKISDSAKFRKTLELELMW